MKTSVREILKSKLSKVIYCINENDYVLEAIRVMAEKNVGALLVKGYNDKICGIITERDYSRNIILKQKASESTRVHEIMDNKILSVELDDTADLCMKTMTKKRTRYVTVNEDGKIIGFLSMGDIVKTLVSDRDFLIDQLIFYITGSKDSTAAFICEP